MWTDNDTDRDALNFTGVADTVAEIIASAGGEPVSVGVAGAWGVGKSSMIRLIRRSVEKSQPEEGGGYPSVIVVEFNAWLYQGYDDARSALMDVIAGTLADEAKKRQKGIDKAKALLKRLNWLRLARLTATTAASLGLGVPPVGVIGDVVALVKDTVSKGPDKDTLTRAGELAGQVREEAEGLLRPAEERTAPKEIQAIRDDFQATLEELGVTLVVLIDDLDRCLPETTISTLEAIRLFLFLKRTAFVIAADDQMIKHAVRKHFEGVDEELVGNYFDKLIQVPIRVPPLGTQEVRGYMMVLLAEASSLSAERKTAIREAVCAQLAKTWQGARVDRTFIKGVDKALPTDLLSQLEVVDRLAPIMTTAKKIRGNPRLIKRFMNALAIRKSIARRHNVTVDDSALTKMLLFERCGHPDAYAELAAAVNSSAKGEAKFLRDWEEKTETGKELELKAPWDDPFVREWLALPPMLAGIDLRGVLYVSREHLQIVTPQDRLSSDALAVLDALLSQPNMAKQLRDKVRGLPRADLPLIMDQLLQRAAQEQEWGTPHILTACIELAEADTAQGERLAGFLSDRPLAQVDPSIVPLLSDRAWAKPVLDKWRTTSVATPVKKAIEKLGR
ncbi:MAG: ATPase [Phycisphaerales bacterium]|nr:ATPase [Phycisphaerales bacterium]